VAYLGIVGSWDSISCAEAATEAVGLPPASRTVRVTGVQTYTEDGVTHISLLVSGDGEWIAWNRWRASKDRLCRCLFV
jgi:hypothetical protein